MLIPFYIPQPRVFLQNKRLHCLKCDGFNLLELMVVVAIVGILTGIGVPSLTHLIESAQTDNAQSTLRKAIATTRSLALSQRGVATLCPDERCAGEWSDGYLLFADKNNNARLDDEETIYQRFRNNDKTIIEWRGSGKANYLKFSSTGVARQFGRFHLCPKNGKPSNARAMVLNRQGRLRIYQDRDKNGVVEDVNGQEPECFFE